MVPFGSLLGHIVTKEGLLTDPTKVAIILNFPTPRIVKHLKGFLGMTKYHHKFIEEYAQITSPLESLLKRKVAWQWTLKQQLAFDLL